MSKSIKVLSIIGIVWASLCLVFVLAFNNPVDYEAGLGWGMFASLYLVAFSIVALVKNK